MGGTDVRIRESIQQLEREYLATPDADRRNSKLIKLMRAWKAISELDATNENSFYFIASHHGAPFRGAGHKDPYYWGGYCPHGNILFPVWHRVYLLELENALRNAGGEGELTVPYWDQEHDDLDKDGRRIYVPWAFTDEKIDLYRTDGDGNLVGEEANPLYSYKFQEPVIDSTKEIRYGFLPFNYTKPPNRTTVRFPLSGLFAEEHLDLTLKHNKYYESRTTELLNKNVEIWLNGDIHAGTNRGSIRKRYELCLQNNDYLTFSNITSANAWNEHETLADRPGNLRISLEQPHNDSHICLGGVSLIQDPLSDVKGANGDMGCNETAAYDPIFFIFHSFIEYMFLKWQTSDKGSSDVNAVQTELDTPAKMYYPGTDSADEAGAPIGLANNTRVTLKDTPLRPFTKKGGGFFTGQDCFDPANITAPSSSGGDYDVISLQYVPDPNPVPDPRPVHDPVADSFPASKSGYLRNFNTALVVSGINRGLIHGSYAVKLYGEVDNKRVLLDAHSVLSRWHVGGCANCQTHLSSPIIFAIPPNVKESSVQLEVGTLDPQNPSGPFNNTTPGFKDSTAKFYRFK
jgi:tyrosinase